MTNNKDDNNSITQQQLSQSSNITTSSIQSSQQASQQHGYIHTHWLDIRRIINSSPPQPYIDPDTGKLIKSQCG